MDPRACNDEKSVADEINVDGTDDKQPIEPRPTKELVSCGVEIILDKDREDKYPIDPSPCNEEKRAADEIKVEGTDDMQPIEPSPCKELVSCGVEIMLDKLFIGDDKQPIEPKPTKELVKIALVAVTVVETY